MDEAEAKPEPDLMAALQRAQADFANFRARMEREKAQWRDDLLVEALRPLMGAFDGLARALEAAQLGGTLEGLLQGVTQVNAQVEKGLGELGVFRIEAVGKPFDPKLHEVVAEVAGPDGVPAGSVVHVTEQGYLVRGRLLRPARVTVSGEGKPQV